MTLDVENLECTVQLNGILSDLQDAVPVYILPGLTPKRPPEISDWKTIMPRNLFRVEFWRKGWDWIGSPTSADEPFGA